MNNLKDLLIKNVARFHKGIMVRYEDFSSYYDIEIPHCFRNILVGPKNLMMICGMDSIFAHMMKLRREDLSIYV